MDFLLQHSNMVDMSRRCGRVESRSFVVPLMSAFHGYHEQRNGHHQQLSGINSSSCHQSQNQTDDSDEDDDCNSRDTDHGVEVDHSDGGRDANAQRDVAAGDNGRPVSQLTTRKHDYSVAELLRNDGPSSSAMYDDQTEVGPSDARRHREAGTSPSKTADSAFHIWNVEQVDRPTVPQLPLPPPFTLSSSHHHRWTDWMVPYSWRRPEFYSRAERRCLGLFDTPPVNFMSTYKQSRHGTKLRLPSSTFGQQYSIPRRLRNYQLI